MMQPLIYSVNGKTPQIHGTAFIAPGVVICGDVKIAADVSIWFGCVLRGDVNEISIGRGSNVQEASILHVDSPESGGCALTIGEMALVGHKCMLHGTTIEDGGFMGMCSTALDHSVIQSGAMLAAGSFLTGGKVVPGGEIWAGSPAKKFRDMTPEMATGNHHGVTHYIENARTHGAALAGA
ncbi:MAG: gamma carbonic anhydrase family protein [Pseudomonadota bacterium]